MSLQTLEKQPSESRLYDFDFSANLVDGETISTISSLTSTPTGLTVGSSVIDGGKVQVRLSAGTTQTLYKLTCRITTSLSNILELDGYLRVEET